VCVTPLCGIQRAQVVAPNEAGGAIDDQQLAMIQGITTRIQQLPGTTNGTVFQHMNSRMKGRLEGAGDDEIAKAIKNDIDCTPLLGFPREMRLKFLANSIIFPVLAASVSPYSHSSMRSDYPVLQPTPPGSLHACRSVKHFDNR